MSLECLGASRVGDWTDYLKQGLNVAQDIVNPSAHQQGGEQAQAAQMQAVMQAQAAAQAKKEAEALASLWKKVAVGVVLAGAAGAAYFFARKK